VSQKKSFSDRVVALFSGRSTPAVNERTLHQKLDAILTSLKHQEALPETGGANDLAEQVRKLAKTQFKTNTLQEKQASRQEATLESLQTALDRLQTQQAEQVQQAVEVAQLELLKSLLPSLDSLDAAFETGRRQVLKHSLPGKSQRAVIAWLDGVRLARLRLLDVLAAHQVTRILTIGQPFDPHMHVAVATDSSGEAPDGIIISEDRAGYTTPHKILRFAEVVVSRKQAA
jgi:molecular chaperone GrpE